LVRANKKWLWLPVVVLLVFGTAFFMTYDFPQKIDLTLPAVQYQLNDPSSAQITTVEVKGKISRPLFRRKEFAGQIRIDGYDFTETYIMFDIVFSQNRGFLIYYGTVDHQTVIRTLGTIWINGDFTQLIIFPFENGQSSDWRISAPARTYEEATKIEELSVKIEE
jgi:hypothetical protein